MEIYTEQRHQAPVATGTLRVIPTEYVMLAYLGDKEAASKIKEIEAHNHNLYEER